MDYDIFFKQKKACNIFGIDRPSVLGMVLLTELTAHPSSLLFCRLSFFWEVHLALELVISSFRLTLNKRRNRLVFLFSYFYYERVIWSLRLLLLFLYVLERDYLVFDVWIYGFIWIRIGGISVWNLWVKINDLWVTSFFTCSARVRFGVLQLWYQSN